MYLLGCSVNKSLSLVLSTTYEYPRNLIRTYPLGGTVMLCLILFELPALFITTSFALR